MKPKTVPEPTSHPRTAILTAEQVAEWLQVSVRFVDDAGLPRLNLAGEACGKAKLTWAQVRRIRVLRRRGVRLVDVAAEFDTTVCNISLIARGKTWKDAA